MLALRNGELLGYDRRNEQTLFNPDYLSEHVVFEKQDLMKIINNLNKLPARDARGYVLIIDEVQDALNSKEAMQEEVRAISSYLATLRSRRYILYFTLPSWNMLVKDARRIMNYVHIMTRRPTTVSYSDLRVVKTDRFNDEPRLWRPRVVKKMIDPINGSLFFFRPKWKPLEWNMPSRPVVREYNKLKIIAQQKKSQRISERMDRAMQDEQQQVLATNELTEEKKNQLKEWALKKIPRETMEKCLIVKNGVKKVSNWRLAGYLRMSQNSMRFGEVFELLSNEYSDLIE